jgi:hypothetical protein
MIATLAHHKIEKKKKNRVNKFLYQHPHWCVIILFGEFWQPGQGIKNGLGERYIILCLLLHIAKTYFMRKIYGYLEEKKKKR